MTIIEVVIIRHWVLKKNMCKIHENDAVISKTATKRFILLESDSIEVKDVLRSVKIITKNVD